MKKLLKFSNKFKSEKFDIFELCIEIGNLCTEKTDAIVNPANKNLWHGGGVAGSIVKYGGRIQQDLANFWISEYGKLDPKNEDFRYSTAFTRATDFLECKYVVHCVGPNLSGTSEEYLLDDERMKVHDLHLSNALKCAYDRAEDLGVCSSIAVPGISSGIFGFPKKRCAEILLSTTIDYFNQDIQRNLEFVKFVTTDEEFYEYLEDFLF